MTILYAASILKVNFLRVVRQPSLECDDEILRSFVLKMAAIIEETVEPQGAHVHTKSQLILQANVMIDEYKASLRGVPRDILPTRHR